MQTRLDSRRDLVDRILNGKLRETLVQMRQDGLNFVDMQMEFRDAYDLRINHETLRRWVREMGIEKTVIA